MIKISVSTTAGEHTLAETRLKVIPSLNSIPTFPLQFLRYSLDKFFNSRSLWQGQRSNQGHTMMLHTCTARPMSLRSINFPHLTVSEIQPGQIFYHCPPANLDYMGEKYTYTALKGCEVPIQYSTL